MENKEAKYFYFELQYKVENTISIHKKNELKDEYFENSNQLIFKPWTSSTGVCGKTIHPENMKDHNVVEQYWIDTSKYDNDCNIINYWFKNILPKLK